MKRYTPVLIAILVVLNLALLWMVWSGQDDGERKGPPRRGAQMLSEALDLSPDQEDAVRELRERHFEQTRSIHREMSDAKRGMFEAIESTGDTDVAMELARRSSALQTELDSLLLLHYSDLLEVCDERQKRELGRIFKEAMRPPNGGPPGRRPPPRH